MTVTYTEFPEQDLIEIGVDGRVTGEDFDRLKPRFEAFMDARDKIRLVETVENLAGFDPALLWKGIRFDLKAIPKISHCAVVTDSAWIGPFTRAVAQVMPLKIRVFPMSELDDARSWAAEAE